MANFFKERNRVFRKRQAKELKLKLFLSVIVFIPDVIGLLLTSLISYQIRFREFEFANYQDSLFSDIDYLFVLMLISAGWLLSLFLSGNYQIQISNLAKFNQNRLIRVSLIYFFIIGFISFSLNASFSRQLFISMFMLGLISLLFFRFVAHLSLIKPLINKKRITTPVLIIGKDREMIDQHIDWIIAKRSLGYKVIGSLRCEQIDFDWITEFDEARSRMGRFEVLLLSGMESDKNFPKFIHYLEDLSIHVNWIPLDSGNLGYWLIPTRQDPLPFLTFQKSQLSMVKRFLKRFFDIVFSISFLLISLPIFLLIAIAIYVSDGRPIFYSQVRIGQNGTSFRFIKFRSMIKNAESIVSSVENTLSSGHVLFKNISDPRVTRIGRYLRKYSLDEFPQFINVLAGNMSVVGPRPALPREVGVYNSLYERRLIAKPGITGPWQVSGRSDLDMQTSISLDLNYLINWSFTSDLWIIIATVGAVVKGKGAY